MNNSSHWSFDDRYEPQDTSERFFVFGFGNGAEAAVTRLKAEGQGHWTATMYDSATDWQPTEQTDFVLLLVTGQADEAHSIAPRCADTPAMVFAVCAEGVEFDSSNVDGVVFVAADRLAEAAESLLGIVALDGYINLDLLDLDALVVEGAELNMQLGHGKGDGRVSQAAQQIGQALGDNKFSDAMLVLYYNPDDEDNGLEAHETMALNELINNATFGTSNVVWGINYDTTLTDGEVRLMLLAR